MSQLRPSFAEVEKIAQGLGGKQVGSPEAQDGEVGLEYLFDRATATLFRDAIAHLTVLVLALEAE